MKIACIGTGFVGVVTAAVFAKLGHEVVGLDIDKAKIALLKEGRVPFFEPGLPELLKQTQAKGKLNFTTDYQEAVTGAEIIFIMVGTPSAPDGQADLKYVLAAAESLAPYLEEDTIIVIKSTVPPGTNAKIREAIEAQVEVKFDLASVPEFLKEGSAVEDTLHPDRVIIGSTNKETIAKLKGLHGPLTEKIITIKEESAQMAKYAANVFLAMRITFANQMADLCEQNGADVEEVLKGIGADKRIGDHYWYPGLGYGGSCFPKDVKEVAAYARSIGETDSIFIAVDDRNEARIPRLMRQYDKLVGGFADKKVAVLGLSFKPNTNDTRVAPALKVIPWLVDKGAQVIATDPEAIDEAKPLLPAQVEFVIDPYAAISGTHVTFLLVEWPQFRELNLAKISDSMQSPKFLIDTRNLFDPDKARAAGLKYKGVGRG